MTTKSLEAGVVKRTLPNGLTVLVKEDHSSPVVAVNVWFGVGSVNETEEINGLAHFQEHMVFKGTKKYAVGEIASLVKGAGGNLNAGTSFSYTMYHVVLPSPSFQVALEVQADAMMNSTFDPDEFQKERDVVIDEARMYDDRPDSFTFYRTMELGFEKHTYRRPIAGYEPIVQKITRDQLLAFYNNYYRPSNAVLVVVGDVDTDDAMERIEKTYGVWEAGDVNIVQPPVEPPQDGMRFKAYTGTMDHGYFGAGFHIPNILHDDYPALEMFCELLSSGRSSRLYRRVVENEHLATSVSATVLAERWPGLFLLMASMPPEKWNAARDAIFEEIERFKTERVGVDELLKARRQVERGLYREMETVEGQASTMGYYQLLGDYRLADRHREAIAAVTPDEILDVATRYFHPANLALVSHMPERAEPSTEVEAMTALGNILSSVGGVTDMSSSPDPSTIEVVADNVDGIGRVVTRHDESVLKRFDLDNGVRVLIKRRPMVPLVSVLTTFQGGSRFEPRGQSGVGMLTHRALTKGTASYDAEEIAARIEGLGGSIDSFSDYDAGGLYMGVLAEYLDDALPIYREVLRHPLFTEDRIEREKDRLLEQLAKRHDNPIHHAMDYVYRYVFGDHPYAYPFLGDAEEAAKLTAANCQDWYRSLLVPANTVVALFGDIEEGAARRIAEQLVGDLAPAPVRTPEFPAPQAVAKPGVHILRRKDLRQSVAFVGFMSPKMMTEDATALQVLNGILAGLGGRLFVELRDKRSLGYMTGSAYNALFERGVFFGYANPTPERVDEAVDVIFAELEKVTREKVTDEELSRSKKWLIGSRAMNLQRNSSQASAYAACETLGFGYEAVDTAPERILAVTRECILSAAQGVFDREAAVVVKLLPEE